MSNYLTTTKDNEPALKTLGSIVINSLKKALGGCYQNKSCQSVGLMPATLWCQKLNQGDRLPRGRAFTGKIAGKSSPINTGKCPVEVFSIQEFGFYTE